MWDDETGYEFSDPKHPTFADRMLGHVDAIRKQERENPPVEADKVRRRRLRMSDEAKTFTKDMQLARGERRYTRKVASPKRWAAIIDAKDGPCRVCQQSGIVEFHHLVPRAIGGSDTEANIVPVCHDCHGRVTGNESSAIRVLRLSLSDDEYAYAVETLGEARFEQRFSVRYESGARSPGRSHS